MTLKVSMLKVTAGTYTYTWVIMIHDLPVMTCIRMDTKFLMPTVPWIHLSPESLIHCTRSIFITVSRKHAFKASKLTGSMNSNLAFPRYVVRMVTMYYSRMTTYISSNNTMYSTILLTIG